MPVGHLGVKYSSDVVPKRESSKYEASSSSASSSFSSSHFGSGTLSSASSSGTAGGGGGAASYSGGAGKQVFSLENGEACLNNNHSSISLSSPDAGDGGQQPAKTVLLVKCTDTSIKAFNQAIATQRKHDGSSASITFKPGGGLINVPVDIGSGTAEIRGLEFKTSKIENVLQCILQPKNFNQNRLINMGEISQQVRINATDEIFQQTKMKMNQAEEDSKKISTKTLDDGFGTNKLSGISKRKAMTEKPKLMAEAAALAKPTLSANKFQQQRNSTHAHSSVRNQNRIQSASPTNELLGPPPSCEATSNHNSNNNNVLSLPSSASRLGAASLLPPSGSSILSASSSALSCTSLSPSRFSSSSSTIRGETLAKSQSGMTSSVNSNSINNSSNSNSPLHNYPTPPSHAMIGSNNSSRSSSPLFGLQQSSGGPGSGFGGLASINTTQQSSLLSQDIPLHSKNNGAVEKPTNKTLTSSSSQLKHNPRNDKPQQHRTETAAAAAFSPPKLPSSSTSSKLQPPQSASTVTTSAVVATGGGGPTSSSISQPNSTNTSSHTNSSPISYGLKDHIVHLLALVDEGGMSVSSLTFRLKSHCKLPSVQYQNVMSALNEVAQSNKTREPVTYSLKCPSQLIPKLIKPNLYPHYSPAERQQIQKKIESITACLSDSMALDDKSDDVSVASPAVLRLAPPPSGEEEMFHHNDSPSSSSSSYFAHSARNRNMSPKTTHNSGSASRSMMPNPDDVVAGAPNVPSDAICSNQQADIEGFKNVIGKSQKSQRKRIEPDSGHDDDRGRKPHQLEGAASGKRGVNSKVDTDYNDVKRFRTNQSLEKQPTVGGNSFMYRNLEVPSQRGDFVPTSGSPLRLNGRKSVATSTPVYGDSPSSMRENDRGICDESSAEINAKMTSPTNGIVEPHDQDQEDKEMQSFASCMANCTYCSEDPLKDFCLLKSEFPPIDSRDEYYQLVNHFKREYYDEFLPLRKKVTETKKTFKQLKQDFDAAKLQYYKVDDPGNRKQLEQLARNVIKVHEDLMHRKDFLKTNHNCNQLHNRLSVMMTRLTDFRDKELLHSTAAVATSPTFDTIYGNQQMTSSIDKQDKKLMGSNFQPMGSSATVSSAVMSNREKSYKSTSTGKHHSGHSSRRSDLHDMVGANESNRKERNAAASAPVK